MRDSKPETAVYTQHMAQNITQLDARKKNPTSGLCVLTMLGFIYQHNPEFPAKNHSPQQPSQVEAATATIVTGLLWFDCL